jgi:hypothetical protein
MLAVTLNAYYVRRGKYLNLHLFLTSVLVWGQRSALKSSRLNHGNVIFWTVSLRRYERTDKIEKVYQWVIYYRQSLRSWKRNGQSKYRIICGKGRILNDLKYRWNNLKSQQKSVQNSIIMLKIECVAQCVWCRYYSHIPLTTSGRPDCPLRHAQWAKLVYCVIALLRYGANKLGAISKYPGIKVKHTNNVI